MTWYRGITVHIPPVQEIQTAAGLKGKLEAKVQMADWGRLVKTKTKEYTRWKMASMAL